MPQKWAGTGGSTSKSPATPHDNESEEQQTSDSEEARSTKSVGEHSILSGIPHARAP